MLIHNCVAPHPGFVEKRQYTNATTGCEGQDGEAQRKRTMKVIRPQPKNSRISCGHGTINGIMFRGCSSKISYDSDAAVTLKNVEPDSKTIGLGARRV